MKSSLGIKPVMNNQKTMLNTAQTQQHKKKRLDTDLSTAQLQGNSMCALSLDEKTGEILDSIQSQNFTLFWGYPSAA